MTTISTYPELSHMDKPYSQPPVAGTFNVVNRRMGQVQNPTPQLRENES